MNPGGFPGELVLVKKCYNASIQAHASNGECSCATPFGGCPP